MKKLAVMAIALCGAATLFAAAAESPGPRASSPIVPIAGPKDRPYPGEIQLAVDASDVGRRIIRVHETVSGIGPDAVLLYPKWLPGAHAPEGPIDRIANLRIAVNGAQVSWTRDPVDVYAFRVHTGPGIKSMDIDFEYLSPTNSQVGALEIGRDVMMIEWIELVLYPAGYFARQIPVQASLTLPADWPFASALEAVPASAATRTTFKRVNLETLIDSPVYAGRYASRLELDPDNQVPVHLDLFADRPSQLAVKPVQLEAYRALVRQAYKLFGSRHFAHYDFLYSLSDEIQHSGLEHHQSSEDGSDPESFTEWDKTAYVRDLLPHEFTHSWNGKFRRPADLWTPNYNVPMQNSLLWVYEGQTQYWGQVLAARSGLWNRSQALDQLALTSAYYEIHTGRQWRTLQDTTNDEIINPRRPQSWRDWQRFEDYYDEGALIWLDADTLIRERSKGRHSLDDFARAFFGIDDGSLTPVTYTFDDVVKTLNAVEPYDWAAFLHQRLDSIAKPAPLDGLRRGGYNLVYSDTPSDTLKASDGQRKHVNLFFSIGVDIDDKDMEGAVAEVIWGSPAFKAKLTAGAQIVAVDGVAYSADVLKDAIRAARDRKAPIELIIKTGDQFTVTSLDYHDGLRYPHLERDASQPPRLDDIMAARP
jgi:predicted metalloprotease with PDZ domain